MARGRPGTVRTPPIILFSLPRFASPPLPPSLPPGPARLFPRPLSVFSPSDPFPSTFFHSSSACLLSRLFLPPPPPHFVSKYASILLKVGRPLPGLRFSPSSFSLSRLARVFLANSSFSLQRVHARPSSSFAKRPANYKRLTHGLLARINCHRKLLPVLRPKRATPPSPAFLLFPGGGGVENVFFFFLIKDRKGIGSSGRSIERTGSNC